MNLKEDKVKKVIQCYTCRDEGGEQEPCEDCGKVKAQNGQVLKEELQDMEMDEMTIPHFYRGKVFDANVLRGMKEDKSNDNSFKEYCMQLGKLHDSLLRGELPRTSAIIVSPRDHGKRTLAYSCMQLAIKAGFKTFPILDTQQLKRFMTIAEERPFNRVYDKWKYEDIAQADILFLTVTKMYTKASAYQVIGQITDMRSRMGRPTIILSESTWKEITAFDSYNEFDTILQNNNSQDPFKYLAYVQYSDYTTKGHSGI